MIEWLRSWGKKRLLGASIGVLTLPAWVWIALISLIVAAMSENETPLEVFWSLFCASPLVWGLSVVTAVAAYLWISGRKT